MPVHMVENYVLRYDIGEGRPWLIVHYKVGGRWKNEHWFPPKEDATFIADMLRNEKPVYFVETSSRKWLTTSSEEIGEEET